MLKRLPIAFLIGALIFSAAPAVAGGDDDHRWYEDYVGRMPLPRAVAIARANGVMWVNRAEFDDDKWHVAGRDESGREIAIEINARNGRVLEVDYD